MANFFLWLAFRSSVASAFLFFLAAQQWYEAARVIIPEYERSLLRALKRQGACNARAALWAMAAAAALGLAILAFALSVAV